MKQLYTLLLLLCTSVFYSQSYFLPKSVDTEIQNRGSLTPIVATIGYQGYDESQEYFGEGEYEIFIDNIDGILDKPIIVLDGFDPGDSRDITGLYNSLSFDGDNMADILRAEGFDIVILNAPTYTTDGKFIDGGSDYIQRNALVLVELINFLNAEKVGDEELVVLGPSMGGLIARYGLSYMEQNSIDHETRLYISFDSPHRGANIPISLQYLINYFAQEVGDATALAIVEDVLNSPAAKEMLTDHYLSHLLAGSTYEQDPALLLPSGAPDFRDAFQNELDALGFPSEVRNVTMINGAGDGTGTGSPNDVIVNTNLTIDALTSADVALRFTPEASQVNLVTDLTVYFIGLPVATFSASSESPSVTDGVDSSPGGTADISDSLGDGGGNPILEEFIEALEQDVYSFIPTTSALAINTDNWYEVPNLNDSPFVNFYIPSENEDHVTVTAASAQFALDEIRQGALSIGNVDLSTGFKVVPNPAGEILRISTSQILELTEVEVSVFGINGQLLYNNLETISSGTLEVKHNLLPGIYIVSLQGNDFNTQVKAIIANKE